MQRVRNVVMPWPKLCERLSRPDIEPLTLSQFLSLPEDRQAKRKNNGYFVGAQFQGGIRRKPLMRERHVITFDVDEITPGLLADLELGTSGIGDLEYVVYSTRKHTAEKPRVRIVIPLAAPISADKFAPLARILAHKLDPEMVTVDPVSFREAQFMYWPSVCSDQKFVFIHNPGAVCDPDNVLAEFGAWENIGNLPHSPREGRARQGSTGSKGDPRRKQNIVGAFCQTYDIHEAIAKFLPDIYHVSETDGAGTPTRYTYVPGSTTNGVVVYDDGYALTSHHGTDPVGSEHSVNPFDLVRIHEFGDLDKNLDEATVEGDVTKLPSFKAMGTWLLESEPEVMSALRRIRYNDDDAEAAADDLAEDDLADDDDETMSRADDPDLADDDTPPAKPSKPGAAWQDRLEIDTNGFVKNTLGNCIAILLNDPRIAGKLAFDTMLMEPVLLGSIKAPSLDVDLDGYGSKTNPKGRLLESHYVGLRVILQGQRKHKGWGLKVTDRDLREAVTFVASLNKTHPVRRYLESLPGWDGVPRVETFWINYCHAEDNAYHRETARVVLIAAVARAMEPGCKFDYAPVLEGPQGTGKSSLVRALGGRFATETEGHWEDQKKFVESTKDFWIVEIPELVNFTKAEAESVKATMTRSEDTVRLAYGRGAQTYPRGSILVGTSNRSDYLRDTSGNRRFWPIACGAGQLDVAGVRRDRDQIWSEALSLYRALRKSLAASDPLPLYIWEEVAVAQAKTMQASRIMQDRNTDLAEQIQNWADEPVPRGQEVIGLPPGVTGAEDDDGFDDAAAPDLVQRTEICGVQIWEHVLEGKLAEYGQKGGAMIREAMKHLPGWETSKHKRRSKRYGQVRVYVRITAENDL